MKYNPHFVDVPENPFYITQCHQLVPSLFLEYVNAIWKIVQNETEKEGTDTKRNEFR